MSTTQDFIVEIGTEELPPLSLAKLAKTFHDELLKHVGEAGLSHQQSNFYATPRRLTVLIEALSLSQEDKVIERQGPALTAAFDDKGNPTPAAKGFARSCGVNVDELQHLETPKGTRLAFQIKEFGKQSKDLMPGLVQSSLDKLPIAKTMRWGSNIHSFIRPVKWLLMMQGKNVVPATLFNCESSNITHGHRFLAAGDLVLEEANEYLNLLKNHYVIADIETRKQMISTQVKALASDVGAVAIIDPDLLDEVTALVEWPVALSGDFDSDFLSVPREALISTMAKNQKYFHLEDNNQQLLAKFITIANVESCNPDAIIQGNERVIRPRLADAKFFYDQDCKRSLSSRSSVLKNVVFQKDLGSLFDKTLRIKTLALGIASFLSSETVNVERAALICKSDLVTDMVAEFPSLQGIMGRYYAANDGENNEVSMAMDEIYMPRFAGDLLPSTETGIFLALADRLDTLVGIFAIGQRPSGNKDPFALRRSALGILRIIIEKKLPLDLTKLIHLAIDNFDHLTIEKDCIEQITRFFDNRLKAMYLDKGISSTVIQSVQVLGISEPVDFDVRIQAVTRFNQMDEAESLAEANKRVANILAKNAADHNLEHIDTSLLNTDCETALVSQITAITPEVNRYCEQQYYTEALTLLAQLKSVIDPFFDSVMIMDEDIKLRQNRLAILNHLRNLFFSIADISCLQK